MKTFPVILIALLAAGCEVRIGLNSKPSEPEVIQRPFDGTLSMALPRLGSEEPNTHSGLRPQARALWYDYDLVVSVETNTAGARVLQVVTSDQTNIVTLPKQTKAWFMGPAIDFIKSPRPLNLPKVHPLNQ